MLAQGINASKACVLLAMDEMFDEGYEGREFLHDIFAELWNETGIPHDQFYLLEESAPVLQLSAGKWTMTYHQGDIYVQLFSREGDNVRLRVPAHSKIIYFYKTAENLSHAVCIHASLLLTIVTKTEYAGLILPREGLLRDNKEFTE